jgi:hypothetical protein
VAAKKLSDLPFDSVTHDGVAHLAADGDPQASVRMFAGLANNDEIAGMNLAA